jgi:hypothetical protein
MKKASEFGIVLHSLLTDFEQAYATVQKEHLYKLKAHLGSQRI